MKKVEDIRRDNARQLVELEGGITKFANRAGITNSRASQMLGPNPTRNIGRKAASDIESKFDKPAGWLDTDHSTQPSPTFDTNVVPVDFVQLAYQTTIEQYILTQWREASEMGRDLILEAVKKAPKDMERLKKLQLIR